MQVQALNASSQAFLLSAPVSTATSRSVSSPHALQIPDRIKISPEAREHLANQAAEEAASQSVGFLVDLYRQSRSSQERIQITQALGALRHPEAVKALEAMTRTRLDDAHENALILALGNTRQASAVAVLNDLYRSFWNRAQKRQLVVAALGETRSPQALDSLRQAYKDAWNSPAGKEAVIAALGQSRRAEAVPLLDQIYEDNWNQAGLRQAVVQAYGQTRSEQGAEKLIQIFNQHYSQPQIRQETITALGQTRSQTAVLYLQKSYAQLRSEHERQQVLVALQAAYDQSDT